MASFLLMVGVLPPLIIAFNLWDIVRTMLASPAPRENPHVAPELSHFVPEDFNRLLEAQGFRFSRAYSFHAVRFAIWVRFSADPPLRTFSVARCHGRTACEFVTAFSDHASLTTTNTRSSFVFPRPFGSFLQSFPGANAGGLLRAHLEGEDYILSQLRIVVEQCTLPFLAAFERDIIRTLSHVTSFRWWVIRGIYWYSIKRFLLHNRPLSRQNSAELYRKPQAQL